LIGAAAAVPEGKPLIRKPVHQADPVKAVTALKI